jgi:uroporphyrinogen decarboxylase
MPVLCTVFNLMGMEETLIAMHTAPKIIEAIISNVERFLLEYSQRLIGATKGLVDIFYLGDDFAGQTGMLISPESWRRFLKPSYKKIIDLAKGHGLKVWFHSCGTFRPVLPDLIDIGIDVWETVQAHLPGNEPEALKRENGREITFFGGISTQYTLPFGTPEQVRAEVRERIRVLGEGGGYICGGDHTLMPETPIENALAMIDEARNRRKSG